MLSASISPIQNFQVEAGNQSAQIHFVVPAFVGQREVRLLRTVLSVHADARVPAISPSAHPVTVRTSSYTNLNSPVTVVWLDGKLINGVTYRYQISVTTANGGAVGYNSAPIDVTPSPSGSNFPPNSDLTILDFRVQAENKGVVVQFTVPPSTTPRQIQVYRRTANGRARVPVLRALDIPSSTIDIGFNSLDREVDNGTGYYYSVNVTNTSTSDSWLSHELIAVPLGSLPSSSSSGSPPAPIPIAPQAGGAPSSSLSTGAIIGITVASIVAAAIIMTGITAAVKSSRRRRVFVR